MTTMQATPAEEPGFRGTHRSESYPLAGKDPVDISSLPGALIAIEGTDSVGRSTHVALLREWLENNGFGVTTSALTKSQLASAGLAQAKDSRSLGPRTMDLFYAVDFADRLETHILPALRAGFVVLTDRYTYATIARSIVRGSDPDWIADAYRFAPEPDAVIYLDVSVESLVPRVLAAGGFDYWESGLDFQEERDVYHAFVNYQTRLLEVFNQLADQHDFIRIDANRELDVVFPDILKAVRQTLEDTGVSPK